MANCIPSRSSAFGLSLLACCMASRPAIAATASASFGVSVAVQAFCQVSYGADHPAGVGATSPVSVRCDHPVSYHVTVGAEQSTGPALPVLETQAVGPAEVRFVPVPKVPKFLRWDRASAHAMTRTDARSAQALSMGAGNAGPRHLPSIANPDAIVITVIY
jgi:hypothetical protein